ncbi:transposase [Streptomyces sp. Qhu_M48]|uniref:transposase n=1 Tax=Streptomyces sp. Qhu_M48 TaxID=3435889 RepID=UPI003F509589
MNVHVRPAGAGNPGREGSKRRVRAESRPIMLREEAAQPFDDRIRGIRGIRQRVTAERDQRARRRSWAFAQLGTFVEDEARRAGVPVVFVDPRDTSRQCSDCRHTHRTDRATRTRFVCRSCGTVLHADHNGSRDIAHRGDAVWKRGAVNRPGTGAS